MHPRSFDPAKIIQYVSPAVRISRGDILHFKHLRVSSAVKHIKTWTFRDRKRPILSFDFILISTLTWITEKELEPEIKTKETNFIGRKTFCSGGKKMKNASGHQGENERQRGKN